MSVPPCVAAIATTELVTLYLYPRLQPDQSQCRLSLRHGVEVMVWVRNLLDAERIQGLAMRAGNSGLILGLPRGPRPSGATVRFRMESLAAVASQERKRETASLVRRRERQIQRCLSLSIVGPALR